MPPKGGSKLKQSLQLLEEGGRRTVEELVFSRPMPREKSDSCLVTWSWPKEDGLLKPSAVDRCGFGRAILEGLDVVKGTDARTIFHLLIAREPHTAAPGIPDPVRFHYHAVVSSEVEVPYWHLLGGELRQKQRMAVDVRIAHDAKPIARMCHYLLAPTPTE
jgi:hypothetical protein